jgi:ferredoxin
MSKMVVDWTRCDGHGSCSILLAEHIDLDEWGFPLLNNGGQIRDDLLGEARRAVQLCPRLALRLES